MTHRVKSGWQSLSIRIITSVMLRRTVRGDEEAAGVVVDFIYDRVERILLNRPDTHDVTHDAFIDVFIAVRGGCLGDEPGDTDRGAWVATIAVRRAYDWFRKNARYVEATEQETPAPSTTDPVDRQRNEKLFKDWFATRSVEDRAVFSLKFVDGLKIKDIADALSIPEGTVKSKLFRMREELDNLFGEKPPKTALSGLSGTGGVK